MVGNVSGKALQTTDLKVYRWPSLIIYLIECKAKRNCSVDGGQVKIPMTFTECSGKVSQDWSCTVNIFEYSDVELFSQPCCIELI